MMRLAPRWLLIGWLMAFGLAACDDAGPAPDDPFDGTWTLDRVRVQPEGGSWVDVTAIVAMQVTSSTLVFDDGAFTATLVTADGATVTRSGSYAVDSQAQRITLDGEAFAEPAVLAFVVSDGGALTLTAADIDVLAALIGIDVNTLKEALEQQGITLERAEVRFQRDACTIRKHA